MTQLIRRRPVTAVLGRTAIDQLFDQFFNDPRPMIKRSTEGYPLTDIYKDDEDNQVIEMALAGFSKEDLEVEIKDNTIIISSESSNEGSGILARRIARRSFTRKFVDYDSSLNLAGSKATFENGLLKIVIPKVAEQQAVTIVIQ
tara:strand:+ start:808 stop:1239 length:432 start_codon:yes stop_codon:yes gene_type:complete